jgi:hypothetical protein
VFGEDRRLRPLARPWRPEEHDDGHVWRAATLARSVQGVGEHASARTMTCVSERAEPTTREWPARGVAHLSDTVI